MKLILVAATVALASSAFAADRPNSDPYNQRVDPQYPYRGSSGMEYKYDLSKPTDQLRYGVDPGAQLRDSISVDPRREIDRGIGQQGGGARR